jgi:hypothetical protein
MSTSEPFLGKPAPFKQAYPEFKTVRVRVKHEGDMTHAMQREQTYTEHSLPRVIPCPNPRCRQGGYDLTATIIAIAHERLSSYKVNWSCNGHEGTPKGRKVGAPCSNSIELEVEAIFNE